MAESCSQVDSDPAVVAPPSDTIKNGKRDAEEVEEPQVVGNKKHKIVKTMISGMETEESITEEHYSSLEQNKDVLPPSPKSEAAMLEAKKSSNSNESSQEHEDANISEENAKLLEYPKKTVEVPLAIKSTTTTLNDAERASISNESEEKNKDDKFKEDHQHLETSKISALNRNNELSLDHPMRLDLATERAEHPTHDTGSKTLYLGNLSFSIEEDDVRDFFKNVGEIAEIRFAIKDDRFMGYGHIEFTTAEAAQEALKLNKEVLLDRQVKLDFARRQRGAYSPDNSMGKSNQRGGHAQVKTVYVRGFECSDGSDNIRSALEKHFGKCGEISRLYIPKDYVSGAPKGVAFIEFRDSNGFNEALGLDGSEVGGSRLTVEEAKKQKGDGREGSGYGGGGWVREIGSARGWGKQYGSDGSGGWRTEGGYSSNSHAERGYGSMSKTGSANSWHRGRSSGGWRWESESSYDGRWGRGSGSNDGGFIRGGRSGYSGNHGWSGSYDSSRRRSGP